MTVEAGEIPPIATTEAPDSQPSDVIQEREQRPLPAVVEAKQKQTRGPHRFGPGNKANPTGRPQIVRDIVLLARQQTSQAIETLAEIMKSKRSPAAARVRAAEVLLDRGYGKAQQTLNIVQHFASQELEDLARKILLKREKRAALESAKIVDAQVEPGSNTEHTRSIEAKTDEKPSDYDGS